MLLRSNCRHCCKKLARGTNQTKVAEVDEACWAHKWTAKFADLSVWRTWIEVKFETISSTSSRIAVFFDRCFPLFFHSETTSWESVSTMMCSLVPSSMSRMPSHSTSASAKRAKTIESIYRADDNAIKIPSLPRNTTLVVLVLDS
jgi:hypothetical protein